MLVCIAVCKMRKDGKERLRGTKAGIGRQGRYTADAPDLADHMRKGMPPLYAKPFTSALFLVHYTRATLTGVKITVFFLMIHFFIPIKVSVLKFG